MSMRPLIFMTALIASGVQTSASNANDAITLTRPERGAQIRLQRAYALPESTARKASVPVTRETVLDTVDKHIEALFDRATDPSTHLVTPASADKAGSGFLIDHFAEIDGDRDGSLRFSEVKKYLNAQSPIARPVAEGIQIIE
ncbi:hypothetical protein LJR231_000210 [Phyllobacterium sp. LjRoot231]|uniref:hypothetical protein n=1 Tax=Phyllobacterium sp. LjRoot231 TaxID=3342289 RepID=UPI003ECC6781